MCALWLERIWPRIELSCELNFFPSFAILHSFIRNHIFAFSKNDWVFGLRMFVSQVCRTRERRKRNSIRKRKGTGNGNGAKSRERREMKAKKRIRTAKYHTNILNTLNQREFILSGRPKHMTNTHTARETYTNTLAFILLPLTVPSFLQRCAYETLCYLLIGIGKVLQIFVN